ncbi:kinase-like domain-containing protein [Chytridium lagenaria]|nr:kinase-like domain-containing protein [Chytridium lagenaria]
MPSSSSLPASSKSSIGVIPSEDIKVDTSACLGSGAAGVVYKARYGNQLVVVKRLNLNRESPETERAFKKEAETLAILNHPRIVRFLGIVMENDRFSIVLEFMPLGSLYQHYTNPKNTPASLSDRLSLTLDIATGMQYLHACQPPVLHRDMKSLNVLLLRDPTSGKLHAKITDFGLALVRMHTTSTLLSNPSVKTGGSVEMTRSGMGTLMWMAPELHVLQATYKKHCDVFSFGVVMTELVSWIGPYGISIMDDRYDAVIHMLSVEKRLPDLSFLSSPSKSSSIVVPNPLLQIIIACLDINPKKRPDFTTIVAVVTKVIDGDQDASPATSPLPTNQQLGYPPVSQTQYQPQPSFVAQPQHQPLHSPANQPQYQAPPPPVTRDFDPTRQYLAAPPPAASFQQIASPHSPHSPHSPAHQLHSPHSPHSSPHQLQAPTPYHYASSNSPAYPDPQFSNPQDHTAPSKSFPTPTRKKLILIILVIVGIVILLAIGVSVGAVLGRNSAQNSPPSSLLNPPSYHHHPPFHPLPSWPSQPPTKGSSFEVNPPIYV